jgi:hypothetical protein
MMRALAAFSVLIVFLDPRCGRTSSGNPIAPTGAPVLTAVTPSQASVGDSITVKGSAFSALDNSIRIGEGYLHGVPSVDGTSLTFSLPEALTRCPPGTPPCLAPAWLLAEGTYQVSVVNANGISNGLPLKVVAGKRPTPGA